MSDIRRILVVDDEEGIRRIVVHWLEGWGLTALAAGSADDAITVMTTEPVDVMITDLIMPVHSGVWLLEHVRDRWPNTAVIVASGAQAQSTIAKTRALGAVAFLPKPFGREMIRQALEDIWSEGASTSPAPLEPSGATPAQ